MDWPKGPYSIIYADPPWRYQGKMMNASVTDHYSVMSIGDIAALPVKKLAAENAVLFLWVTSPKLNEFMSVVTGWGFAYKTVAFVWVKLNPKAGTPFMGQGRWTRANAEFCILATRGSVPRLRADIRQLQMFPREEHSKKPSRFRDLIVALVGDLPRVELFARHNVDGWDAWGDEL